MLRLKRRCSSKLSDIQAFSSTLSPLYSCPSPGDLRQGDRPETRQTQVGTVGLYNHWNWNFSHPVSDHLNRGGTPHSYYLNSKITSYLTFELGEHLVFIIGTEETLLSYHRKMGRVWG